VPEPDTILPADRRELLRPLLDWYSKNARDLPWRRTSDPYAIWVSEIMLQQTQVATVLDYYRRFLAAFPDVATLAAADEQTVLGMWSGLGYYRRARQMHAAAQKIVAEFTTFPTQFEDILALPGIGRYTAGAIASFAFDQPAPIVEANTQRLFARLLKLQEDPRSNGSQQRLWRFAESLLPTDGHGGAGRINQAVMELGSQVCTPRDPACTLCPLRSLCPTYAEGLQDSIPVAAPKKVVTELIHLALVVQDGSRFLLRQNTPDQWWQGLWDFPRLDLTGAQPIRHKGVSPGRASGRKSLRASESAQRWNVQNLLGSREWLEAQMSQQHGLSGSIVSYLGSLKHAVTRYRIELHAMRAEFTQTTGVNASEAGMSWFEVSEIEDAPLTAPARKLIKKLSQPESPQLQLDFLEPQ
jgi:A/G-specific adenine glycosylase